MGTDNKRFRGYNANPQLYRNIDAIINDLDRIHDMKFTTLWLNPLFEPCASVPDYIPQPDSRPGSPYAQRSMQIAKRYSNHPNLPDEARQAADYKDIRRLTDEARKRGMRPMADLVLNHVAIDNPLVSATDMPFVITHETAQGPVKETVRVNTSQWFKRHASTNALVMRARDEHYQKCSSKHAWDDIASFNYDDPATRKQIIDCYLKPLVKTLIVDMGFDSFRFDAAGMIPPAVYQELLPYMDALSQKEHGHPTRNMAETAGPYFHEHINMGRTGEYKPGFADYAYDSTFFAATDDFPFHSNRKEELFSRDDSWASHIRGTMDNILRGGEVRYYNKRTDEWKVERVAGGDRGVGSITGSLGNHDEERYTQTLVKQGVTQPEQLTRSLKRKLAVGAFYSSGGHFMQVGDEFGVLPQAQVFTAKPEDLKQRMPINLTRFVREINTTLARMPNPQHAEVNWAQAVELKEKPDLMAVIVHHGPGHTGRRDLVVVNLSGKREQLDSTTVKLFMEANGRNQDERARSLPEGIHLVGGITPSVGLQTMAREAKLQLYSGDDGPGTADKRLNKRREAHGRHSAEQLQRQNDGNNTPVQQPSAPRPL